MPTVSRAVLTVTMAGVVGVAHAGQPLLQLQGQPYFDGSMTLHVTAPSDVGDLVWLGVGLDPLPLDAPVPTSKGPWYIGNLLSSFVLGTIQGNGRLDLDFTMPPTTPGVEGTPLALQAYVAPDLSNPAILPLDAPYFTPAKAQVILPPEPQTGAIFGDRVAVGDLNADGEQDVVVGAWFEDWAGLDHSGRVYVMWGPDYAGYVALASPLPVTFGGFGGGLAVADLDLDGIDDLVVGEIVNPDIPTDTGTFYVYWGGSSFTPVPGLTIQSPNFGLDAHDYGRGPILGDLNGDGWPDLADGMYAATVNGMFAAGQAVVWWGPGFSSHTLVTSPIPQAADTFGRFLSVGDVNGDGIDDLIEGNGGHDVGPIQSEGNMHVFVGPGLTLHATIPNPYPGTAFVWFGDYTLAADLTGDGLADAVTRDDLDRVYIFEAPEFTSFIQVDKPPSPAGNPPMGFFGYMLAAADVNGDGLRDLVIGDPLEGTVAGCLDPAWGTLFVALAPYFSTFHRINAVPGSCGSAFADTGGIAAELDGDERPEIVVGSYSTDYVGLQNAGQVTIFDINEGGP